MSNAALIMCAGRGTRTGLPRNKLLEPVAGSALIEHTLKNFLEARRLGLLDEIVLIHSEADGAEFAALSKKHGCLTCQGGETRTESVRRGLAYLKNDLKCGAKAIVLICDGARPNTSPALIAECVASTAAFGSGIAAIPATDTIILAGDAGIITETVDRSCAYLIQTPQAFTFGKIFDAYEKAVGEFTDDGGVYRSAGYTPVLVDGDKENYKITDASDLARFRREKEMPFRTGLGADSHRFTENRPLILGGVTVPSPLGLAGHSDADALCHAVCDALLSACGLSDIGTLFPDTDPEYKDADSLSLLKSVGALVRDAGFLPVNVAAVIHAEKPKLAAHIPAMRENLAAALGLSVTAIGISAKTGEGMGFIGRGEGLAVQATAAVTKADL